MMKEIVEQLKMNHQTITFAESLTCGLAAATLGDVPSASQVFQGSFVTYSAAFKEKIGVPPHIIMRYGVVSEACAKAMAIAAKQASQSDYALSFTGVAGPDTLEGHPAGTVWIGLASPTGVEAREYHFSGTRSAIRQASVDAGFLWLKQSLNS